MIEDIILRILGPLLGAFLAAMVALYVMNRNIKYDKKKQQKIEIENHIKSYLALEKAVLLSKKAVEAIIGSYNLNLVQKRDFLFLALDLIRRSNSQIANIKDEYISKEHYSDFLEIKSIASILEFDVSKFLEDLNRNDQRNYFFRTYDFEGQLELLQNSLENIKIDAVLMEEELEKNNNSF